MSRTLWRAVALALVLAAAAATAFWLRLPARLPSDDDYRKAAQLIQERAQPGDVVVLAPAWAERGRQFVTGVPVEAGYDLAHDAFPGTKRWWVLALADAPRFDLAEARRTLQARGPSVGEATRIGGLSVELYAIAGPPAIYRFTDHIPEAQVSLSDRDPCRYIAARQTHQCSRGEWNAVHAGWWEVQERPLRCMWAHPVDRDSLRIRFDNVPKGARIAGRGAFVGQAAASNGAPVFLTVESDGRDLGRVEFPNRFGPQPFSLEVPEAEGEAGTVIFSVTTPNSGMRHFCFDAWVEEGAAPAPQVER